MRHPIIDLRLFQERICQTDDVVICHTGKLDGAGGNGFGTFGFPTQHQNRLAHGGSLLLQAAGVGHNKATACNQVVHFLNVDRVDQMNALHAAQLLQSTFTHNRA